MENEKKDLKIFIIDDSNTDLEILQFSLKELGFRNIIKSSGGMEAVRLVEENHPDLVFIDIIMPGVDGGTIKELLTENPKTTNIPTIFVSSIISKEEQKHIKRLSGGDIIIAKPYTIDEISKAIDSALGSY